MKGSVLYHNNCTLMDLKCPSSWRPFPLPFWLYLLHRNITTVRQTWRFELYNNSITSWSSPKKSIMLLLCSPRVMTPLFCVCRNFSRSAVLYQTPLILQTAKNLTRRHGPQDSAHNPSLTDPGFSLRWFSIYCNKNNH
jgi:hypothetical protein